MAFSTAIRLSQLSCRAPSRRATIRSSSLESLVEAVLVQVASHAIQVTARGHLLLIALECLRGVSLTTMSLLLQFVVANCVDRSGENTPCLCIWSLSRERSAWPLRAKRGSFVSLADSNPVGRRNPERAIQQWSQICLTPHPKEAQQRGKSFKSARRRALREAGWTLAQIGWNLVVSIVLIPWRLLRNLFAYFKIKHQYQTRTHENS